ncbi:MAG: DUF3352 domain-containing protein [Chloroflexota bacterium]
MFKRFSRWSLLLVALLSISLVLGACGDLTSEAPANVKSSPNLGVKSALAESFPQDTALYISLNTDTSSNQIKGWQKVTDYLSAIPEVKDALPKLDVLAQFDLGSFETTIKPWLGNELALGLTDLNTLANLASSKDKIPSGEIPLLLAAPVKDKAKLETFVTDFLAKLNLTAETEIYNGATLKNISLFTIVLSIGYSDSKLFIGGSPALVKAALDRTTDKSLASTDSYKKVTAKLPADYLAFIYGDVQGAIKTLNSNPNIQKAFTSDPKIQDALKGVTFNPADFEYLGNVGVTLAIAPGGFRIDAYQPYQSDKASADVKTRLSKPANPNTILNVLPENTFFFATGQDGKSGYADFAKKAAAMGEQSKQITDGIQKFETTSGLNIQNDLASLFPDEFVLFAQPVKGYTQGDKQSLPLGIGLLTKVSDKAVAQANLDKITAAIAKADTKNELKFQPKTIGGVTFQQAVKPGGNLTLNLGIANGYAFFSSSEEQTQAIIDSVNGKGTFLKGVNATNFNQVKESLPQNNRGYLYLDLQQSVALALATLPVDQATKTKAYTDKLTAFKALGFASSQTQTEVAASLFLSFPEVK